MRCSANEHQALRRKCDALGCEVTRIYCSTAMCASGSQFGTGFSGDFSNLPVAVRRWGRARMRMTRWRYPRTAAPKRPADFSGRSVSRSRILVNFAFDVGAERDKNRWAMRTSSPWHRLANFQLVGSFRWRSRLWTDLDFRVGHSVSAGGLEEISSGTPRTNASSGTRPRRPPACRRRAGARSAPRAPSRCRRRRCPTSPSPAGTRGA